MWPPLAAITRSNRDRKPLQTFPTKPFLVDCHARFTEALGLCWCKPVLQAFSSMCVHKLKLTGFKSEECEAKSSCWRPTSPARSLPRVLALRPAILISYFDFLVIFLAHGRTIVSKTFFITGRG